MRLTSVWQVIPLALATTLVANAQPFQGVYVGAGAGYNITQAVRATPLSSSLGSNPLHLDEGGGFAGVASHIASSRQPAAKSLPAQSPPPAVLCRRESS
jgi:hypothetical protein